MPADPRFRPRRPRALSLLLGVALVVAACGGEGSDPDASGGPASSPEASLAESTPAPVSMADDAAICEAVVDLQERVATLRAIELRLPNRVALGIELDGIVATFGEVQAADLGEFEEVLEEPLQRLAYRLVELELAVEDFRTNPRPRRAAPHVETDSKVFADELAAFSILARC